MSFPNSFSIWQSRTPARPTAPRSRDAQAARAKLWAAEITRHDRAAAGESAAPLVRTVYWIDRVAWIVGPIALGRPAAGRALRSPARRPRGFGRNSWLAGIVIIVGMAAGCAAVAAVMLAMPLDPPPPAPSQPPLDRFAADIAALGRERKNLELECARLEQELGPVPGAMTILPSPRFVRTRRSDFGAGRPSAKASEDVRATDVIRTELNSTGEGLSQRSLWHAGIGLALCLFAASGWFVTYRGDRRRRAKRADTCPACAQRGSMRIDRRTATARCGQAACGFELPEADRMHCRLSIAIIGAAGSGKTHWLAAATRELAAGRYPVRGTTVASKRTSELDAIANTIFDERRGPSPTVAGALPVPMLVHDRDRLGSTNLMLTVREVGPGDSRPLRADGLIVALDPTQPVEPQRAIMGLLKHARRVPLGFAVTKIDRLTGSNVERFHSELAALDPAGRSVFAQHPAAPLAADGRVHGRPLARMGLALRSRPPPNRLVPADAGGPERTRRSRPAPPHHRAVRHAGAAPVAGGRARLSDFALII